MANILFACYHHHEMGTVNPVALRLVSLGHQASLLTLVCSPRRSIFQGGRVYRMSTVPAAASGSEEFLKAHVLVNVSNVGGLAKLLLRLQGEWKSAFPLQPAKWAPAYVEFVQSTFDAAEPDIVVLSVGQFETPLVRQACIERGIPCIYQLVPFYEFKTVERLALFSRRKEDDEFMVAGELGVERLRSVGVSRDRIIVTGSPLYDGLHTDRETEGAKLGHRMRVLYAEQGYAGNGRLRERLLHYLAAQCNAELAIRLHPTARPGVWSQLSSEIQRVRPAGRVRVSPRGLAISEDLKTASVLVTISSLAIHEAVIRGVPVVCWCPSFLPPETTLIGSHGTQKARTSAELYAALDVIQKSIDQGGNPADILSPDRQSAPYPIACERVCERILQKCHMGDH